MEVVSSTIDTMADEQILKLKEKFTEDESIRSYECYEYQPITGTQLNNSGEIRITVESQDEFFHPHDSYLVFEGKLVKVAASAVYADADVVTLTSNALMYIFSNIKYELSGHDTESINYPGQATTMFGLLKYSNNFSKSQGLNQCWYKDTSTTADLTTNLGIKLRQDYIIKSSEPNGSFSFAIPMKHIFGFCEDYNRIIYGMKQMITLVRAGDDDAIFRATAADAGKCVLEKVSWFLPRVLPNDNEKFALMRMIESKSIIDVGFRRRQCDTITVPQSTSFTWRLSVRASPERAAYVIIGFQTDKANDQKKNPSIFDNCNVKNMYIMLNSTRYPAIDFNADFAKHHISRLYKEVSDFIPSYYGTDGQSNIDPSDYISLYPLFVFNVSKQSEGMKGGITDLTVKMEFSSNVAANTQSFALVISDRLLKFQSDGSKMNVVI